MGDFQTYGFEYQHDGSWWVIEIKASSPNDARDRLDKLPTADYIGELRSVVGSPADVMSAMDYCTKIQ